MYSSNRPLMITGCCLVLLCTTMHRNARAAQSTAAHLPAHANIPSTNGMSVRASYATPRAIDRYAARDYGQRRRAFDNRRYISSRRRNDRHRSIYAGSKGNSSYRERYDLYRPKYSGYHWNRPYRERYGLYRPWYSGDYWDRPYRERYGFDVPWYESTGDAAANVDGLRDVTWSDLIARVPVYRSPMCTERPERDESEPMFHGSWGCGSAPFCCP